MDRAKLFRNGRSQAVRLPKDFRLPGTEVYVKRVGNAIVLIPVERSWDTLFDSLSKFSDDFMADRNQPPMQDRAALFD